MPVSGMSRVTPPMMMKVCRAKAVARPAASSLEKPSGAKTAMRKPRHTKSRYTRTTPAAPSRPISLAMAVKMKSVCRSGTTGWRLAKSR